MNLKEKLTNNLAGNIENHIFPFLWMRGESEEGDGRNSNEYRREDASSDRH